MNQNAENLWAQLKTCRDELRVQANLANREFKDEWDEVEKKWELVEQKLEQVRDATFETAIKTEQSTDIILDEIAQAYDRIKHRLHY